MNNKNLILTFGCALFVLQGCETKQVEEKNVSESHRDKNKNTVKKSKDERQKNKVEYTNNSKRDNKIIETIQSNGNHENDKEFIDDSLNETAKSDTNQSDTITQKAINNKEEKQNTDNKSPSESNDDSDYLPWYQNMSPSEREDLKRAENDLLEANDNYLDTLNEVNDLPIQQGNEDELNQLNEASIELEEANNKANADVDAANN